MTSETTVTGRITKQGTTRKKDESVLCTVTIEFRAKDIDTVTELVRLQEFDEIKVAFQELENKG